MPILHYRDEWNRPLSKSLSIFRISFRPLALFFMIWSSGQNKSTHATWIYWDQSSNQPADRKRPNQNAIFWRIQESRKVACLACQLSHAISSRWCWKCWECPWNGESWSWAFSVGEVVPFDFSVKMEIPLECLSEVSRLIRFQLYSGLGEVV